jgi:hypothetical protein
MTFIRQQGCYIEDQLVEENQAKTGKHSTDFLFYDMTVLEQSSELFTASFL